jgi:signal transduction histidine kinase/CHASE3 domain sensor protein
MKTSLFVRIVFTAIIVLLLFTTYVAYRNIEKYIDESRWIRHSNEVINTIQNVRSELQTAVVGHLGYQITKDSIYLASNAAAEEGIYHSLDRLDSLVKGDTLQKQLSDSLRTLSRQQFNLIREIIDFEQRPETRENAWFKTQLMQFEYEQLTRMHSIVEQFRNRELLNLRVRSVKEQDFRYMTPLSLLLYSFIALGACTFLFLNISDALSRKEKAEKALQSKINELNEEVNRRTFAEKSLQKVLDGSPNGISAFHAIRDDAGTIIDFEWYMTNRASERMVKKDAEQLIGKRLLEMMPNNKTEGLFDVYCQVVESGLTRHLEKYYEGEGIKTWFHIIAVKNDDGFIVTFSDITQSKQQILKIQESEMLLREAELLNDMGNWRWNLSTHALYWSEGVYRIFEKNAISYIPAFSDLINSIHPDEREAQEKLIKNAMAAGNDFQSDFRITTGNKVKYLQMKGRPTYNSLKELNGFFGTLQDFTAERQLEEQLRLQTLELKRSNEDLEQFAYVASHDLQEPLRKIQAFGDRLQSRYENVLEDSGLDYLERMQNAAGRMQKLIEDLLTFSRVTRKILPFQSIELQELIAAVVDDLEQRITETKAQVQMSKLPLVYGDPAQLQRLFLNLIGNAIKFRKENEAPRIEITSQKLGSGELMEQFGINAEEGMHHISIADNGIGFDEKHAEKIFNIFQRLHGRSAYPGTGIGLAICRKIVMAHNGYIFADGEAGRGARFSILMPLSDRG